MNLFFEPHTIIIIVVMENKGNDEPLWEGSTNIFHYNCSSLYTLTYERVWKMHLKYIESRGVG
jgi:hypothetical protein